MEKQKSEKSHHTLNSVQLGWLIVEVFGRFKMYERARNKPNKSIGDRDKRFVFSTNKPTSLDELQWSIQQLHHKVVLLELDSSPPLPNVIEIENFLKDDLNLDTLQAELNEWSKKIWCQLNAEDGVLGRGFVYGGSLADTFWSSLPWSQERAKKLLNSWRLLDIEKRFKRIDWVLPPNIGSAICNSLHNWSKIDFDSVDSNVLEKKLKSQFNIWRNLLFGRRNPESYLKNRDHRIIGLLVKSSQIGLAILILALLTIAGWGVGSIFPEDSTNSFSSFFAAASSLVVIIVELAKNFSTWVARLGDSVKDILKQRYINFRTLRDWQDAS